MFHDRWVAEVLEGPIPAEALATCHDCAMCDPAGATGGITFDPGMKCCSYVPELANFMVGAVLNDATPEGEHGRVSVRRRIEAGVGVTPLGLATPRPYQVLYKAAPEGFGRSRALRCPHYVDEGGGLCGIWRYRESVCATWHCKYVRGATGARFWNALQRWLSAVERDLAHWCLLDLDVEADVIDRVFERRELNPREDLRPGELDGHEDRADLWGAWAPRKEEFYRACAARIEALSPSEVLARCSPRAWLMTRLVQSAHAMLRAKDVPTRLEAGQVQLVALGKGRCQVVTYNPYDPLDLPQEVIAMLARFDGRPTEEVLAEIEREEALPLDVELVRLLVDFEVLVAAR
jgi:hypothetical protein